MDYLFVNLSLVELFCLVVLISAIIAFMLCLSDLSYRKLKSMNGLVKEKSNVNRECCKISNYCSNNHNDN